MMNFPFRVVRFWLALILFSVFAFSNLPTAVAQKAKGQFVLVIDAGHGGRDHGAPGKLTVEKHINLNVALAFGKLVEDNFKDVKVIYTRKTDVFIPLKTRAEIANRNKADLFVSIHTNAVESNKTGVSGAETYSLGMHRSAENLEVAKRENSVITQESNYKQRYQNFDPRKAESYIIFELMQDQNMKQSVSMAQCIQQQYGKEGRRNKGVKQAGFLVLHATSMPSVLTELGFISHPEEERFLHSKEGVNKLARSLYNGFRNYRRQQRGMAEGLPPEALDDPQRMMADKTTADVVTNPTDVAPAVSAQVAPAPRPQLLFMDQPLSAATQTATNGREQLAATSEVSEATAAVVPVATRPFRSPTSTPALPVAVSGVVAVSTPTPPPAVQKEFAKPNTLPESLDSPATTKVENLLADVATATKAVDQLAEATEKVATIEKVDTPERLKPIEAPKTKVVETQKVVETPQQKPIVKDTISAAPKTEKAEKTTPKVVEQTSTKTTEKTQKVVEKTPTAPAKTSTTAEKTSSAPEKASAKTEKTKAVAEKATPKTSEKETAVSVALPEFRVQILTSERNLRADDRVFKGLTPIAFYQEGGRYKYTHGSTDDFAQAQKLRKKITTDFPEAFIIALLDGKRIDIPKAKEIIAAAKNTSKK